MIRGYAKRKQISGKTIIAKRLLKFFLCTVLLGFAAITVPEFREMIFVTAYAEDLKATGQCGTDAAYTFDMDTGTLTISGSGSITDGYFRSQNRIKKVIVKKGITSIGRYSFEECQKLESVSLPYGLKVIGYNAFNNCSELKSAPLPSTLTVIGSRAFCNCSKLQGVKLPPELKEIGSDAFYACYSITEVNIPSKLTRIEYGVFNGCSLKEVTIPATVEYISSYAFSSTTLETVTILSKTSGSMSFAGCSNLKTINISAQTESLPYIGDSYGLEAINIDPKNPNWSSVDGVLYSKDKTILKCYPAGKDIEIPSFVREIGKNAFYRVESGSVIIIPENVEEVNEYAFGSNAYAADYIYPVFLIRGHETFVEKNAFSGKLSDYNCPIYAYEDNSNINVLHSKIIDMPPVKISKMSDTVQLKTPEDMTISRWYSSDPSVLTVDENGMITPLKRNTIEVYGFSRQGMCLYTVSTGFKDVAEGTYYYDPVYWAVKNNITVGVRNSRGVYDRFDPQGNCTRAQMVTFLWRMAGCPEPKNTASVFTDIKPTDYFYKAVLWGTEKNIIGGYADKTFRPQNDCTRQQAVTFLWRYYGRPTPETIASPFKDVKNTKAYYYEAVLWASEKNVTGGYSDGTFKPENQCSRAQMVTFLYRCRNMK